MIIFARFHVEIPQRPVSHEKHSIGSIPLDDPMNCDAHMRSHQTQVKQVSTEPTVPLVFCPSVSSVGFTIRKYRHPATPL